jgi:hypothetical protein
MAPASSAGNKKLRKGDLGMRISKKIITAFFSALLGLMSTAVLAEPGIDVTQLEAELYGNGRETGVTGDPVSAVGAAPWSPEVQ